MGITVKSIGNIPIDRSVSVLEINTSSENRDDWKIEIHFQDAPYDGEKRLDEPRSSSERVVLRYGDIKDLKLESGGVVSDLFEPIRALCYAMRQRQVDAAAAKAQ